MLKLGKNSQLVTLCVSFFFFFPLTLTHTRALHVAERPPHSKGLGNCILFVGGKIEQEFSCVRLCLCSDSASSPPSKTQQDCARGRRVVERKWRRGGGDLVRVFVFLFFDPKKGGVT